MARDVFEERWHKMCTTEYKWKWARRGRIRREYQLLRGKLPQQEKQEPEHCLLVRWPVPSAVGGSSQMLRRLRRAERQSGNRVRHTPPFFRLHPFSICPFIPLRDISAHTMTCLLRRSGGSSRLKSSEVESQQTSSKDNNIYALQTNEYAKGSQQAIWSENTQDLARTEVEEVAKRRHPTSSRHHRPATASRPDFPGSFGSRIFATS